MRKFILLSLLMVFAFSYASNAQDNKSSPQTVSDTGKIVNDGSSFTKAIVIEEKKEGTCVKAEYTYIREHYAVTIGTL